MPKQSVDKPHYHPAERGDIGSPAKSRLWGLGLVLGQRETIGKQRRGDD